MSDFSSLRGQFLVSLPSLASDYFQHTITLLIEHNRDGAFGLVINRPLGARLPSLFEKHDIECTADIPLLETGPVERNRLFFLHSSDRQYRSSLNINKHLTLSTSPDILEDASTNVGPKHLVAGLGYAGWRQGQLEDEIKRDVWLVTPFEKSVIFVTPFEQRPEAAAKLIGVDLNLISPTPGHG